MAQEFSDGMSLVEDKLIVLDFWAEWCGPCRAISGTINDLANEFNGKAIIGKVNIDYNPSLTMRFGITSIPTILFIKGGQVVDKIVGATGKPTLSAKIQSHL